jgi:hypothetical protein
MKNKDSLKSTTDEELLRGLADLLKESRDAESELAALLAEVDRRKLVAEPSPSKEREAFKFEFTADAELRDKLERLRELMRSSIPDGDLGAIIEDAVTEYLSVDSRRRSELSSADE